MKKKTYTKANSTQLEQKQMCIDSANQYKGESYHVELSHESIYDFNGCLSFVLSINANAGTGLLCLTNKSWIVNISRGGTVRSKRICTGNDLESPMKRNKHRLFIA